MKSCEESYTEAQLEYLRGWAKERKNLCEIDYRKENKKIKAEMDAKRYNPTLRKEKAKKKRDIKEELTDTCKGCNKKFWHTSILKHISQMKSCEESYTEGQMEYLRGWARERKNLYEIDYKRENKESIAAKRSQQNKKKREERNLKRKEEIRAKYIESMKVTLRNNKVSYERNARQENQRNFNSQHYLSTTFFRIRCYLM